MRVVAIDGPAPQHVRPGREAEIYGLLVGCPDLFEKNTLFRVLSINVRTEKGPDFIAVNHKGHLIIGEVKRGGMSAGGWVQAKRYAKLLGRMRESELDQYIWKALDNEASAIPAQRHERLPRSDGPCGVLQPGATQSPADSRSRRLLRHDPPPGNAGQSWRAIAATGERCEMRADPNLSCPLAINVWDRLGRLWSKPTATKVGQLVGRCSRAIVKRRG